MAYFVIGATGPIGTNVVEQLMPEGHDVIAPTRSRANASHLPERSQWSKQTSRTHTTRAHVPSLPNYQIIGTYTGGGRWPLPLAVEHHVRVPTLGTTQRRIPVSIVRCVWVQRATGPKSGS